MAELKQTYNEITEIKIENVEEIKEVDNKDENRMDDMLRISAIKEQQENKPRTSSYFQ